jgi:phosphomannomutase
VVGHDARLESPGLAQAVMRGLNAGGGGRHRYRPMRY